MYRPGSPPQSTDPALAQWLRSELLRIYQASVGQVESLNLSYLHAPPEKVIPGMIVLADGSDWDPGDGVGVYRRSDDNTSWEFLEATGASLVLTAHIANTTTAHGATTVGNNVYKLTNPAAITWIRINADNTVTARSASDTRGDLGLTSAATATPSALTRVDDSNITLTLGGTPATALLQATSITVGWSGLLASSRGGTGNGFTKFSGPTTSERTKTLRDADDTVLELGGSYTPTGTWTSMALVTPALGTPASGNLANCTFPTLNQNTTGSAAKWTTARNLAGNSVDGSANVAFANKFIVQGTADAGLSAAQFLGGLGTGILKNTTTTGVLSIAAAGDFPTLNQDTTGNAATVTIANEASDTTCFPLFGTAATGNLGLKTNATLVFDSSAGKLGSAQFYTTGGIAQGTATISATDNLTLGKNIEGGTTARGVFQQGTVQSGVTTLGIGFQNRLGTAAASFTLAEYRHFFLSQTTIGAGSAVTLQSGFDVDSSLTGAGTNYAFRGRIAAASGRWNLFMDGTAQNAIAGLTRHGSTTVPTCVLDVTGSIGLGSPVTKTANYTLADSETFTINNKSGSGCVVTLPAASSQPGRTIWINNIQAQTVTSASSNVVPRAGGAAGTAILSAAAGQWAMLVSDGTNWKIMAGS